MKRIPVLPFLLCLCLETQAQTDNSSDFEAGSRAHAQGNIERAMVLFRQGAEKGDSQAQFALGSQYYIGEGVAKDLEQARKLFEASSASGNAESAYMLSLIYGRGEGVDPDPVRALELLTTAAYRCLPQARNELAQMYYDGYGVGKDTLNGIAWLVIAAERENEETRRAVDQIVGTLSAEERSKMRTLEQEHRAKSRCPAR